MWSVMGLLILGGTIGFFAASFMASAGQADMCSECMLRKATQAQAELASEAYEQLTFEGLEGLPRREPIRPRYHKHTKNYK